MVFDQLNCCWYVWATSVTSLVLSFGWQRGIPLDFECSERQRWEVRKPRINADFALSTLQNQRRKLILSSGSLWEVPLNTGEPLESKCCHKDKGIWNMLIYVSSFTLNIFLPLFFHLVYLSTWANPGFHSNVVSKENCQWKGLLEASFLFFFCVWFGIFLLLWVFFSSRN